MTEIEKDQQQAATIHDDFARSRLRVFFWRYLSVSTSVPKWVCVSLRSLLKLQNHQVMRERRQRLRQIPGWEQHAPSRSWSHAIGPTHIARRRVESDQLARAAHECVRLARCGMYDARASLWMSDHEIDLYYCGFFKVYLYLCSKIDFFMMGFVFRLLSGDNFQIWVALLWNYLEVRKMSSLFFRLDGN